MGVVGGIAVAALLLVEVPETVSLSPAKNSPAANPGVQAPVRQGTATGSITNGLDPLRVSFENGLLDIHADHVRLASLLKEISRRAYVAIELDERVAGDRVSVEFTGLALEEGLRRVLAGYDVFTYHRGDRGLLTVWVYGKLEGRGLIPVPYETWASTADLRKRLEDSDPAERAAALESLVERGGRTSEQEVVRALDDPDAEVRTVALNGALNEGLPLPGEKLADLAFNDSSYNVRFLALRNLAGQPGELPALEAALNDPNPVIRSYAEAAMLRLDPDEEPPGAGQLQNSNP